MLFTEQDLQYTNVMDLLENANYLSEQESIINPKTIPVRAVDRIGYGVVRFDDVDRLAENHGVDYIDAMYMIAEASEMNPEYLAVAVPEEDVIAYPEIVNELANIVIAPLSEDSFAYQYVGLCLEAWDNTGDEGYLGAIIDDDCLEEAAEMLYEANSQTSGGSQNNGPGYIERAKNELSDAGKEFKAAWAVGKKEDQDDRSFGERQLNRLGALGFAASRHKAVTAGAIGGTVAVGAGLAAAAKYVREARNKPKSWIGKKIAALRSIYQKWMQQAQKNPQKAGPIKSAAAKLLSIIDQLMAKMQQAAG